MICMTLVLKSRQFVPIAELNGLMIPSDHELIVSSDLGHKLLDKYGMFLIRANMLRQELSDNGYIVRAKKSFSANCDMMGKNLREKKNGSYNS
jgi:hypothetical protein